MLTFLFTSTVSNYVRIFQYLKLLLTHKYCISPEIVRHGYWVDLSIWPLSWLNSLLPTLMVVNIKSSPKNKNWAWRYIEIIDTKAANTIRFDIAYLYRNYISIISRYKSITIWYTLAAVCHENSKSVDQHPLATIVDAAVTYNGIRSHTALWNIHCVSKKFPPCIQPYAPHLNHVATLPLEIKNSNFLQIFNRYGKMQTNCILSAPILIPDAWSCVCWV